MRAQFTGMEVQRWKVHRKKQDLHLKQQAHPARKSHCEVNNSLSAESKTSRAENKWILP